MSGALQTLTWTLIHSLWIAFILWVIVSIAHHLTRRSAIKRHIKIAGLLCFFIATSIALFLEIPIAPLAGGGWIFDKELIYFKPDLSWFDKVKIWIATKSFYINLVWLLGTSTGALRYIINRQVLRKYEASAIPNNNEYLNDKVDSLRTQLRIRRKIQFKTSSLIDSPITTGVLRPIIYFPIGLASGFSNDELDTIVLHELAHIKNHDYLINLLLVLIETLFFFNPFVHLMIKDLRREMEYTCDDMVLFRHGQIAYARTLVKLQEFNMSRQVALAARNNKSEFKNRIERMINSKNNKMSPKLGIAVLLVTSLFVSSAFVNNRIEPDMEMITQSNQQDTIRVKNSEELKAKIKELSPDAIAKTLILMDGKPVRFIKDKNNALSKAKKMMEEVQRELMKDGLLNEQRQKITLMFQYSDVLNGKQTLGDKYEKYKGILNRYFPVYDSFATTRIFRYKKDN